MTSGVHRLSFFKRALKPVPYFLGSNFSHPRYVHQTIHGSKCDICLYVVSFFARLC